MLPCWHRRSVDLGERCEVRPHLHLNQILRYGYRMGKRRMADTLIRLDRAVGSHGPTMRAPWLFALPRTSHAALRAVRSRGLCAFVRLSKILHGTADNLNFHSKAPQQIDGDHPPVGIERNHVGEHAAKGEGFRGFAQASTNVSSQALRLRTSVSTLWNPRSAFSRRASMAEERCSGGAIVKQGGTAARHCRGPGLLGLHHPVQKLAQALIRTIPWKYMYLVVQRAVQLFVIQRLRQIKKTSVCQDFWPEKISKRSMN